MIASAPNPHQIHLNLFCQASPVAPSTFRRQEAFIEDPVPAAIMDVDQPEGAGTGGKEREPRGTDIKKRKTPDSEDTAEPAGQEPGAMPEAGPTSGPDGPEPKATAGPEPKTTAGTQPEERAKATAGTQPEERAGPEPEAGPERGAEEAQDEPEIVAAIITKKTKKRNRGLKRAAWIESKIAVMKREGRWYGSDKPNPQDRLRRMAAEQAEAKK